MVAITGGLHLVYGTSASAPVVASILTMINDARLAIGLNPIGWINPAVRFHWNCMGDRFMMCSIRSILI